MLNRSSRLSANVIPLFFVHSGVTPGFTLSRDLGNPAHEQGIRDKAAIITDAAFAVDKDNKPCYDKIARTMAHEMGWVLGLRQLPVGVIEGLPPVTEQMKNLTAPGLQYGIRGGTELNAEQIKTLRGNIEKHLKDAAEQERE